MNTLNGTNTKAIFKTEKIKYLYLKIYNNTIAYINRQKAVDKIYINFNIYQVGLTQNIEKII